MKKFLIAIIFLLTAGIVFSSHVFSAPPISVPQGAPTIEPTPTIELLPINDRVCDPIGISTVYPPNSVCHDVVDKVETLGVNLVDSNEALLSYPLTCISAPSITYSETIAGGIFAEILDRTPLNSPLLAPLLLRAVDVKTDITNAQLGFLGPDSTTLATTSPDKIAQKYLFNALFDRPGADPEAAKESFRTYWRMLDSLSQAQLKAYFIEKTALHTYYYVGQDKKQHEVSMLKLKADLFPYPCLRTFGVEVDNFIVNCWKNGQYLDQYEKLGKNNPQAQEEYDQLLPFDFNNARGYTSSGLNVSEENIPYLRAILTGLKGFRGDITLPVITPFGLVNVPKTDIPGLFDFYTPGWATDYLAQYPTTLTGQNGLGILTDLNNLNEFLQYPLLLLVAANPQLNGNCTAPSTNSSQSTPRTYPNDPITNQIITFSTVPTLISRTENECYCNYGDSICYQYGSCGSYAENESTCLENNGYNCLFKKGESTYELTGAAKGKPITVFNNPYINSLTDLVMGGKPALPKTSSYPLTEAARQILNWISDKIFNPVQPSFYKMLLPDFASESASPKKLIGAPAVDTTATPIVTDATVTVDGANAINRENNLAQDAMHLLQNCWLVPSDQQSSSKCGRVIQPAGECALSEEPLTELCNKSSFTNYAAGQGVPLSSFIPLVPPELSAVYAEAEKVTGTSCVILAAIHYREGSNGLCTSLISGRKIGEPEPDNGGAVYSTLLETAIAAGNEFQGKLNFARGALGAGASDYQLLTTALSFYNGGGNSNCLSDPPSSDYGQCPPLFRGEDDPYPLNFIDPKHSNMYLRCLRDHDCSSSVPDPRPGVYTAALNYYNSLP